MPTDTPLPSAGMIEPDVLYALPEARRRLGWGKKGMQLARQRGLNVSYAGKNGYVVGRDIIEFIQSPAGQSKRSRPA